MPRPTQRQVSDADRARILKATFQGPEEQRPTYRALAKELGLTERQVRTVADKEHRHRGTRPTRKKARQMPRAMPNVARGGKRAWWELRENIRAGVAEIVWGNVQLLQKQLEQNQQRETPLSANEAQKLASALRNLVDMMKELGGEDGDSDAAPPAGGRVRDLTNCPRHLLSEYTKAGKIIVEADAQWDVEWKPA